MRRNELGAGRGPERDTWLTPPELLRALGRFDTDPCCPPDMPWRTARRMLSSGGLEARWSGRVWLNPPYSDPLPWLERLADHGSGTALLPNRSCETRWGQSVLLRSDLVLFMRGRLLMHHHPDGRRSSGKWTGYLLAAYGARDVAGLVGICGHPEFGGVLMERGEHAGG